jgi:Gamma-glutamyl cyclotransferase, AIG2-like
VLYFAYGSNMNWAQMKERCPASCFVGIAVLPDHRLAFTRKSVKRGCGVADALRDTGRKLWSVVYEISDLDIGSLDRSEGYRSGRETNSYCRRECTVFLDGEETQPLTISTNFGEPQ